MQKRKFKINILDIVIFVVVLCSVALLIFRDTVSEAIQKPETGILDIQITVDGEENVRTLLNAKGDTVDIKPKSDEDLKISATIIDVSLVQRAFVTPTKCVITVYCSGYERLGRYYSENGKRIYENSECVVLLGETEIIGQVGSIDEIGN